MNTTKDLITFFADQFRDKYKLPVPKMTTVKDGIYIYGGGETTGRQLKIFISLRDFNESPDFYETYLENCHDAIIKTTQRKLIP